MAASRQLAIGQQLINIYKHHFAVFSLGHASLGQDFKNPALVTPSDEHVVSDAHMMMFGGVVPGQKFTMDKHIHCRSGFEKQQKGGPKSQCPGDSHGFTIQNLNNGVLSSKILSLAWECQMCQGF